VHCACNTVQLSENVIFVFPCFACSAEAQLTWGGIVKHLFIAYFIGNFSAKKISKSIHMCQSYSKPKVGRFLWHGVYTLRVKKKQSTIILSITSPYVDEFSKIFTDRFNSKYATKMSLTIPPHLTCVAELPCEASVSENSENLTHASLSTTNHKVVCLRCGGLFSNHFTTD